MYKALPRAGRELGLPLLKSPSLTEFAEGRPRHPFPRTLSPRTGPLRPGPRHTNRPAQTRICLGIPEVRLARTTFRGPSSGRRRDPVHCSSSAMRAKTSECACAAAGARSPVRAPACCFARSRRGAAAAAATPPPRPRARHGADPPHSLPGALPGKDHTPASRPGGLQGVSRTLSCQPRPPTSRVTWAGGLRSPTRIRTRRRGVRSPVGPGGQVGNKMRWPHVQTSGCAGAETVVQQRQSFLGVRSE